MRLTTNNKRKIVYQQWLLALTVPLVLRLGHSGVIGCQDVDIEALRTAQVDGALVASYALSVFPCILRHMLLRMGNNYLLP